MAARSYVAPSFIESLSCLDLTRMFKVPVGSVTSPLFGVISQEEALSIGVSSLRMLGTDSKRSITKKGLTSLMSRPTSPANMSVGGARTNIFGNIFADYTSGAYLASGSSDNNSSPRMLSPPAERASVSFSRSSSSEGRPPQHSPRLPSSQRNSLLSSPSRTSYSEGTPPP